MRAERELIAPRADAPAELAPGETLSLQVAAATGLTPPPGIQEDRALRLFSITLCADGLDLGAGTRRCFPLAVRNVRPLDASSLRYRVEAPLPVWVAPGSYDLSVRFPGAQISLARAVLVRDGAGQSFALAPRAERRGEQLVWESGPGERADALVRVHVGAAGLALSGASLRGFPLPDTQSGFAPGFVALVQRSGPGPVSMTKRHEPSSFPLTMRAAEAEAGRPVRLEARGAPPGARIFWWLDPARGGLGSDVTTVFLLRGQAPLQLFAVTADGRFAQHRAVLPIWQRRAFGCSARGQIGPGGHDGSAANSLILLVIWGLLARRSRGGARFAIARGQGVRLASGRGARVPKGSGGRG